jgi:hypothetical protein
MREKTAKTFPTAEAAKAAKPAAGKARLYRVTAPDGTVCCFTWAYGRWSAVGNAALAAGYKATTLDKAPTKDSVAAGLAGLSPEDRAVLIAQYLAPNGPPAGTPDVLPLKPPSEKTAGKKGGK